MRYTRVHAARIFADVARGKWRPKFRKCLMLLAHNSIRSCLLEFRFSVFVVSCSSLSEVRLPNLDMSRFISLTKLCSAASLQELHITPLEVSHMLKINSFSITQQKTSWIYLDIAAFQDFKVSLLLPHACEDFASVYLDRNVKKIIIIIIASLSFA